MQPRKGGQAAAQRLYFPIHFKILFGGVMVYMDVNEIVTLCSNMLFPCVMCFLLWRHMTETSKALEKTVTENTVAVAKMTQLLEDMRNDERH